MFGFKTTLCFCVFNFISIIHSEEELVQMLKKKVILLDESLTMDIRLLRQDIKKNSEEFSRLSNLLDETLATFQAGEDQPIWDSDPQVKLLEATQGFERAMSRIKRAFSYEKSELKKFKSTMKIELNYLANTINKALSDFTNGQVEARKEMINNLESFKTEITNDLSEAMSSFAKNLTTAVKSMSSDIAQESNKAFVVFEKISPNVEMVPEIKEKVEVLSRDMLETPFATSEQLFQVKEAFENKFKKMIEMLNQVRTENFKIYSKGNIGLENVTRSLGYIQGRLVLRVNGTWGTVHGYFPSNIACKMLGFSREYNTGTPSFCGKGTGPVWELNRDSTCRISSLFDCPDVVRRYRPFLFYLMDPHDSDVAVFCEL